jgi:hypothetical protein
VNLVDDLAFELDLASEAQAFALQAPVQAFLRGPALQIIDEVFNAATPGGDVWRLERLTLDLGTVAGPDLPALWAQRLRDRLHEALHDELQARPIPAGGAAAGPQRLRTAEAALSALLHLLHHGRLPWHGPSLPPGGLGAWAAAVVQAQPQAVAAALRAPGAVQARERVQRQWPGPALAALAGALAGAVGQALPLADWVAETLQGLHGSARVQAERALWASAVTALLRPGGTDAQALRAALRRARRTPAHTTAEARLATLAQALQTGQGAGLAPLWRAAWRADPTAAAALLRRHARRPRLRRLLVLALPPADLHSVLQALAPQALAVAAPLLAHRHFAAVWRSWLGLQGPALQRRLAQAALDAVFDASTAPHGEDHPTADRWLETLLRRLAGPGDVTGLAAALQRAAAATGAGADASAAPLQAWLAQRAAVDGLAAAWQRTATAIASGQWPDSTHDLPLLLAQDRRGLRAALRPLARQPQRARAFAAHLARQLDTQPSGHGQAWLQVLAGADSGLAAALLRHAAALGLGGSATRQLLFEALLAEPAGPPDRRRWFARFLRGVAAARRQTPAAVQAGLQQALTQAALPAALLQPLRALVQPPPRARPAPAMPPPPPSPLPLERLLQPQGTRAGTAELAAWHRALDQREPTLAQRLRQMLADARVALSLVRRLPTWILQRLLQRLRPGQRTPPAALPADGWIALLQGRALPPPPPVPALDDTAPIAVGNAGLVLLAPYVPRWMALLGLAVDGRFTSTDAAQRAVLLLQWLVQGTVHGVGAAVDADETELALPRLLCGVPFLQPLPRAITLDEREAASGQQLLQAVITHWGALGHTTVAGLRETFLQREGRLQRQGEAWRLQVVPRAFDLLLDRLPWGWQTLKLSTMDRVLHVDWR